MRSGDAQDRSSLFLVPKFSLVTRIHVLTAIKVHDQDGAADFLARLGFEGPADPVLVERGKRYHAGALLSFAHGRATGQALSPHELPAGATEKVLGDLGFTVAWLADLDRPAGGRAAARVPGTRTATVPRARATKVAAPKAPAKPEPVVSLCPTCFMQLPATGRCDYCD